MTGNRRNSQAIEGEVIVRAPSPRLRLTSLRDVRREMAKVYADMRQGRIETSEGTRLTYVLSSLAKVIEVEQIEEKVDAVLAMQEQMQCE